MINIQPFKINNAMKDINTILYSRNKYDHVDYFPSLNKENYTYFNGKYVENTAFFIDLRNSSKLLKHTNSRSVARYYRAYISEVIRILRSRKSLVEINIVGDCVSGIFAQKGPNDQIDEDPKDVIDALTSASMIHPLIKIINILFAEKYPKDNFFNIKAGIGLSRGTALIIKAGEYNSGENKYIFLGKNVNKASHLCDGASKHGNDMILMDNSIRKKCKNHIAFPNGKRFYDMLEADNEVKKVDDNNIYGGNFCSKSVLKQLDRIRGKRGYRCLIHTERMKKQHRRHIRKLKRKRKNRKKHNKHR